MLSQEMVFMSRYVGHANREVKHSGVVEPIVLARQLTANHQAMNSTSPAIPI
jgi:hypothetical protein